MSGLSLEALIEAKSRGATFGALSDTEMQILASAASKIGTWRNVKDGRVTGYDASESSFKEELNNIRNTLLRASKGAIGTDTISGVSAEDPLGILDASTSNLTNPLGI